MEELQVIETTSGRQFKPWATKDDVQEVVSGLDKQYTKTQTVTTVTTDTTFQADGWSGWAAINTGEAVATVNGIVLDPFGTISGVDFTASEPNVVCTDDITVTFGAGGNPSVTVIRVYYAEVQEGE